MGQYYMIVNTTKKQFIHPHKFGDGLKLLEFGDSRGGTMLALAVLLADGNGRGGGDLNSKDPVIGSWAGDKIVISGDYADPGKFMPRTSKKTLQKIADKCYAEGHNKADKVNLNTFAEEMFEDISVKVMAAMMEDKYIAKDLEEAAKGSYMDSFKEAFMAAKILRKMVA